MKYIDPDQILRHMHEMLYMANRLKTSDAIAMQAVIPLRPDQFQELREELEERLETKVAIRRTTVPPQDSRCSVVYLIYKKE